MCWSSIIKCFIFKERILLLLIFDFKCILNFKGSQCRNMTSLARLFKELLGQYLHYSTPVNAWTWWCFQFQQYFSGGRKQKHLGYCCTRGHIIAVPLLTHTIWVKSNGSNSEVIQTNLELLSDQIWSDFILFYFIIIGSLLLLLHPSLCF